MQLFPLLKLCLTVLVPFPKSAGSSILQAPLELHYCASESVRGETLPPAQKQHAPPTLPFGAPVRRRRLAYSQDIHSNEAAPPLSYFRGMHATAARKTRRGQARSNHHKRQQLPNEGLLLTVYHTAHPWRSTPPRALAHTATSGQEGRTRSTPYAIRYTGTQFIRQAQLCEDAARPTRAQG